MQHSITDIQTPTPICLYERESRNIHDSHSFKFCGMCILIASKVLRYKKCIVLSVKISTSYSITCCNSVIRVGNSGRGLRERNATQTIQTLTSLLKCSRAKGWDFFWQPHPSGYEPEFSSRPGFLCGCYSIFGEILKCAPQNVLKYKTFN